MLQKDVLAIIISEQKPNNKMCTVVNEDKQIETFERDANFVLPMLDFYSMKVVYPELVKVSNLFIVLAIFYRRLVFCSNHPRTL